MRKALIGISLDNPNYGSKVLRSALLRGLQEYDQINFLVADSLQLYNYVSRFVGDRDALASLDWSASRSKYVEERQKWLQRVRSRLPAWPAAQEWKVIGAETLYGEQFSKVRRSVEILYSVDDVFRNDVNDVANRHAKRALSPEVWDARFRLSVSYVLEELAINVFLRVSQGIKDEYYLGETLSIFVNTYSGIYLKDHHELFGGDVAPSVSFRFFGWSDEKQAWELSEPALRPSNIRALR